MDGRPKGRVTRDASRRPKGLAGEGWTVGLRAASLGIPRGGRRASLRRVDGRPKGRVTRDASRRPKGLAEKSGR